MLSKKHNNWRILWIQRFLCLPDFNIIYKIQRLGLIIGSVIPICGSAVIQIKVATQVSSELLTSQPISIHTSRTCASFPIAFSAEGIWNSSRFLFKTFRRMDFHLLLCHKHKLDLLWICLTMLTPWIRGHLNSPKSGQTNLLTVSKGRISIDWLDM